MRAVRTASPDSNKKRKRITAMALVVFAVSGSLFWLRVVYLQDPVDDQATKDLHTKKSSKTSVTELQLIPTNSNASTKNSTSDQTLALDENFMRPILFSHFHKSGGSSVCVTMKKFSNMSMTNAKGDKLNTRNCNAPFSGPKFNVQKVESAQTCESLTPLTTDAQGRPFHRLNFLAVEVPYKDKMPCPGFRSFAVMRHPVARVISHLSYHGLNQIQLVTWIKDRTPNPTSSFIEGYPVVNNMVIRQLLGRKRYRNVRPIDQRDLAQAKKPVDLFHAFVPLEYLRHDNVSRLLNSTIPEYYQALQVMNVTAKHQRKRAQPSAEFVQVVTEENKYDILLYQYMLERLGISS